MAVTIKVHLLAGRYHATPWDHNVNEERCEWPPSPWRVLRTLVAMGHRLQVPREQIHKLMSQLSSELPSYRLPPSDKAHTRHWVPIVGDKGPTTSLIWDTFLATEKSAQIVITWHDLNLSSSELQLLQQLCRSVSYLGRAESWANLEASEKVLPPKEYKTHPVEVGGNTRLLAPLNFQELQGFQHAMAAMPNSGSSKLWTIPKDILEVLEMSVSDYHSQGWSNIPGAKWVPYRVQESDETHPPKVPQLNSNFARFQLVAPVLPLATKALSVGERFRQALMSFSDAHPIFSGKSEDGSYSKEQHQHAHYLPEINRQGHIEHVLVYAPAGFPLSTIQALQKLRRIWDNVARDCEIQVVLVALGEAKHYEFNFDPEQEQSGGRSSLLARAQIWKSATPLILPRYPMFRRGKPRMDPDTGLQKECAEYQVLKMLEQQGFPKPKVVEVAAEDCDSRFPWLAFQHHRHQGEGSKGPDKGFGFRLEFPHPVTGPIALGYGSHFGLGVFRPEL